jgi:PAS domain S-box-containing protein
MKRFEIGSPVFILRAVRHRDFENCKNRVYGTYKFRAGQEKNRFVAKRRNYQPALTQLDLNRKWLYGNCHTHRQVKLRRVKPAHTSNSQAVKRLNHNQDTRMHDNGTILHDASYYQAIIEASYNGIIAIDETGRIIVFNRSAKRILKCRQQDYIGTFFKEFDANTWPQLQAVLTDGKPKIGQKNRFGEATLISNLTPILIDRSVKGVISEFQDISEYERISKALTAYKQLAKELDTIIESFYDGISLTDGDGKLLRVNSAWEKITGLKMQDVVGKNMAALEKEGYLFESVPLLALKHRKRITKPTYGIGSGKDVLVTSTPVFDEQDHITQVVTNVRDMTDLNTLNKQLEQSKQLAKKYYAKLVQMRQDQNYPDDIVAVSKEMRDVADLALRIAETDAPILVQGETGVGKGVIAKMIHDNSSRAQSGPFVKINCGAIPENLLESELFGYEKGAFTGAKESGKKGRFEHARGGTILLDEMEAMPLNLQVKLLSAVQDMEFVRVGGSKPRKMDTRIITASNKDLYVMVQDGTFREDLFFRLNVVPITIPPLRQRKDDILPLVTLFLEQKNVQYGKNKIMTPAVIDYLRDYQWLGNVRELSNLVEQLVVITQSDEIVAEDLPRHIRTASTANLASYNLHQFSSLKQAVMEFESHLIQEAVKRCGNARKAAHFLKVDPTTITRKIKKYKTGDA